MRETVYDLDEYINTILGDYDRLSPGAYSYLAEELNALQQLYFERYAKMPVFYSYTGNASTAKIMMNNLISSGESEPDKDSVLAVLVNNRELPLCGPVQFARSKEPAATVVSDGILLRTGITEGAVSVSVICYQKPLKIEYSEHLGFIGDIYIPEKHLPMISAKVREIAARMTGEAEEADSWASIFNGQLELLERQAAEANVHYKTVQYTKE